MVYGRGMTTLWDQFSFEKRRGNRYEHLSEDGSSFLAITIWKGSRGGGWTGTVESSFLPPYTQVVPQSEGLSTKEAVLEELLDNLADVVPQALSQPVPQFSSIPSYQTGRA